VVFSKTSFGDDSLKFLGHIASRDGIRVNPAKVDAVTKLPSPTNRTSVRSFIARCSYYRKFVPGFAAIARPLYLLCGKMTPFKWTEEAESAFQHLKELLTQSPVLAFPMDDAPTSISIHTNASDVGLGAVLYQMQDGVKKVLEYASRALSPSERNYGVPQKEMKSVVWAVDLFRPCVYG
jgi:hypothetical protein